MGIPDKENNSPKIPRDIQLAAAEIAAIGRKYGLSSIRSTLLSGESYEQIELHWQQGRHGVEKDEARLSYHKQVTVDLDELLPEAVEHGTHSGLQSKS